MQTKSFNTYTSNTTKSAFKLLENNIVDIVIASSNTGNAFIKKNQYIHITELKPSLEKIGIYHYVHKKHKNLVPKIDRIIKEMIKNNEIKKIIKELILSSK